MIKYDLGKALCINGHAAQVATEFEELARAVRSSFCEAMGKTDGERLFDECIKNSKMNEEERDSYAKRDIENARISDPESAKEVDKFVEALCAEIFGRRR